MLSTIRSLSLFNSLVYFQQEKKHQCYFFYWIEDNFSNPLENTTVLIVFQDLEFSEVQWIYHLPVGTTQQFGLGEISTYLELPMSMNQR